MLPSNMIHKHYLNALVYISLYFVLETMIEFLSQTTTCLPPNILSSGFPLFYFTAGGSPAKREATST